MQDYTSYSLGFSSAGLDSALNLFKNSITDNFSTSTEYEVDDFVIYNGALYQCVNPCDGDGDPDNGEEQIIFPNGKASSGTMHVDGSPFCTVPTVTEPLYYTGSTLRPKFNNYLPDKLYISGATGGIEPGEYTSAFEIKNTKKYKWADGSTTAKFVTGTIQRAVVQLPVVTNLEHVYDGTTKAANIVYDSSRCTITGATSGINAGTYSFTIALNNTTYMQWADSTTAPKTFNLTIAKSASLLFPKADKYTFMYTGSAQGPTLTYDNTKITASGDLTAINAGDYTINFHISNTNYAGIDGTDSDKTLEWSILDYVSLDKFRLNEFGSLSSIQTLTIIDR